MLDAQLLKLPVAAHQHNHQHHQVVVGVQGTADLTVEGTDARLDNWNACMVPTEATHDYCGDDRNHVLVINLDPSLPELSSPAHGDYDRLAPLFEKPRTLAMDSKMQGLVQFVAGEFDRSPDNAPMQRHLAAGILHCMADRLQEERDVTSNRNVLHPGIIRRYILDNLHHKITVSDLASVACLSVSRFHEIFREVTGVTPYQFLLQTRLDQACKLLASSSLSVSEVSYRTGFSSHSALTNALRKHRGITPTKLRFGEKVA
ncbi:helix-turn-helix domain-containing protein [Marinobacter salinisoli]|uniref:Helix-turn-helix domain-containing protein n=1 Tax=Marinobacter salinisoli TaxID=2769486 RepID=A0ABX7MMP8_9GAMM|nr:AraC family transcriptional regulator [Marinobacter salinisoli]QSP93495.1 helix-turn-helix domain-containing protein [Marinobacter salinisoli]